MPRFKLSDLPEIGDVVKYSRGGYNTLVLPVTHVEDQGGYTDIWLGEQVGKFPPLFNVNHTTGLANTHLSDLGRWEIVRKHDAPKPDDIAEFGETVTNAEQMLSHELYDMIGDHFPSLLFFDKQRVVIATIKAIRKEA